MIVGVYKVGELRFSCAVIALIKVAMWKDVCVLLVCESLTADYKVGIIDLIYEYSKKFNYVYI